MSGEYRQSLYESFLERENKLLKRIEQLERIEDKKKARRLVIFVALPWITGICLASWGSSSNNDFFSLVGLLLGLFAGLSLAGMLGLSLRTSDNYKPFKGSYKPRKRVSFHPNQPSPRRISKQSSTSKKE